MYIFYVDESYDQTKFIISSLRVDVAEWKDVIGRIKAFRVDLRNEYGIKLKSELHAQTFVRHCSDGISSQILSIFQRRVIFERCIDFIATLPIQLINVCLPLQKFAYRFRNLPAALTKHTSKRLIAYLTGSRRMSLGYSRLAMHWSFSTRARNSRSLSCRDACRFLITFPVNSVLGPAEQRQRISLPTGLSRIPCFGNLTTPTFFS
jgi:hypothetical protein